MIQRALFDQYFLKNHQQFSAYANKVKHHFANQKIVEFGVGHGEISLLTLQMGVKNILGFEIDKTLNIPSHPALHITREDFNTYLDKPVINEPHWVIANPPYIHLPAIASYTHFEQVRGYLLIMSDWRQAEYFSEAKILGEISKEDFNPVPIGRHVVVFHNKT